MNLVDYYVIEVLSNPVYHIHGKENFSWWEVKVSYYYDNGELKEKALTFNSEEEARQVKKGYHFTA